MEKEIQQAWPDAKLYLFFAQAFFGLEDNGTDMPFFHSDTIMTPETKQQLGKEPAVRDIVKCAIFDWGDRCKNPSNHYKEFIEYCEEELKKELTTPQKKHLETLLSQAQNGLAIMDTPIS